MLEIRLAIFIDYILSCVDRTVVRFVVDHQDRQVSHQLPPGHGIRVVGNAIAYPSEQTLEDRLVLLDHEQPRSLFRCNPELCGRSFREVAVLGAIGCIIGADRMVSVDQAHADGREVVHVRQRRESEESLVQADLGLSSQIVMQSRQDDDDLVSGISRLADQSGVVSSLARLDMSYNQARSAVCLRNDTQSCLPPFGR